VGRFCDERFGEAGQQRRDAGFAGGHGSDHGSGEPGGAGQGVGGGAQQVDDALGWGGAVGWGVAGWARSEALFGERGDEEVFFGGEVSVDSRRGHSGAGDDLADAQRVEATLGGEQDGGVHDLFAAFGLSGLVRAA
jgi:hypothetical protein